MSMTWEEECAVFLRHARGDLALYLCLCALRKTENGGPGKEMGILDGWANTFDRQVQEATTTIRHNEIRVGALATPFRTRSEETGLFTTDYLLFLSAIYAPIGAENDPHGLNKNHGPNLRSWYEKFSTQALQPLWALVVS